MNTKALLIGGIVGIVVIAMLLLVGQPAPSKVDGNQPKIMVVMDLHMDPVGVRGDEQQRLNQYAQHRDAFLWLQDLAKEKGFKISAAATGLYTEFAVRNGHEQDFADFMPGGTHLLGTHLHSHYKSSSDTGPYHWTEDETHGEELAQQVYDDQIAWVNQIFTKLGFAETDNHFFHGSHTPSTPELLGFGPNENAYPNVFDVGGGQRGLYHPELSRPNPSIVSVPNAAGIFGADALHGPEGMVYGSLPFVQRDFSLEYAEWWYQNQQGSPPLVWVFGYGTHPYELTEGFRGTDGRKNRETLPQLYDWLNANFEDSIEYATFTEVADAYMALGASTATEPVLIQSLVDALKDYIFKYVDLHQIGDATVFEYANDQGHKALLVLPGENQMGDFSEFLPGRVVALDISGTSEVVQSSNIQLSNEPLLILTEGYDINPPEPQGAPVRKEDCMESCISAGKKPYECMPSCGIEPGMGPPPGGRPCGDGVCTEFERQTGVCPEDCA